MSADNWAVCPVCRKKEENCTQALKEKADASYGKVPKLEYERLQTLATIAGNAEPVDLETFREDYRIGITQDGDFYVDYGGGCDVCGASFSFKHEVKGAVR